MSIFLFSVLLMSGCALDKMRESLPRLEGQSIDTAVRYLGLPDEQFPFGEGSVYVWSHSESGSYMVPVTSTTTYPVFGRGGYDYRVGAAYTTTNVPQSYHHECSIKAVVNKDELINSIEYEGDEGGCSAFADSMDRIHGDFEPRAEDSALSADTKPR